jgi:phytoene synthase
MAEGGPAEGLEQQLRQVDPDRWLTSRFVADASARADLAALYLYDHELARARRAASTPLLAEIRLTWWREALDEIFAGDPVRHHPTAQALGEAVRRRNLPRAPLEEMIDGQIAALDTPTFDGDAALAWADAVEGSAAGLAAMILDPAAPVPAAAPAGRAWGLALLLRAGLAERETVAGVLATALADARAAGRSLTPKSFPAALPARLARFALTGRAPGPLRRQLSLIIATATGRV